jgi:minimal PKS acyl carrier protein
MTSTEFTSGDLTRILAEAAGGADAAIGDILDTDFQDLGYDSLAMLEAISRIERAFCVTLDDSTITEATTPRALIQVVNEHLAVLEAS